MVSAIELFPPSSGSGVPSIGVGSGVLSGEPDIQLVSCPALGSGVGSGSGVGVGILRQ